MKHFSIRKQLLKKTLRDSYCNKSQNDAYLSSLKSRAHILRQQIAQQIAVFLSSRSVSFHLLLTKEKYLAAKTFPSVWLDAKLAVTQFYNCCEIA